MTPKIIGGIEKKIFKIVNSPPLNQVIIIKIINPIKHRIMN